MCHAIGTPRTGTLKVTYQGSLMFLNPWYSGQPTAGSQPAAPVNGDTNSQNLSSPEEVSHSNYPSDTGQDFAVEQVDLTEEQNRQINAVQQVLRPGWTVHLLGEGRFYYCNHYNQTSGWLPPADSWHSSDRLPYGWETGLDPQGKVYFINHINKTTSAEDPRKWEGSEQEALTEPRTVELTRDSEHGFGFVAGSEKPVIVRFVRSGGPSVDRLMHGDLILKINGEDVRQAPRDHVIQLIRDCQEKVTLEVCQPPLDNTSIRKSGILSAAKKTRLKSQPSRVRFAESVDIDGQTDPSRGTTADSVVPLMPNVLKVFLENGQTKSFKYDTTTRVQDVINSLQAKLGLSTTVNFALVVEHVKSARRNKFTILDPTEHLTKIASRPGVHNLRCLFRVTFYPADVYDLLCQDPQAFEYLYVQCCNDVVQERFSPELQNEVALRLASLHMYQHAISANGNASKITVKMVEKEYGLERFVPGSLAETMKKKEMQKLLGHFLKINTNMLGPGQKQLTALQAQLHYLKIIAELPSYGAKCFSTNISDSNVESVILISPKFGLSQISSLRNGVPLNLCDFEDLVSLAVSREDQVSHKIYIQLKNGDKEGISLTLESRDSEELILVLQGYFRLLCAKELEMDRDEMRDDTVIPYRSKHQVTCQGWNYSHSNEPGCFHFINFGNQPPYQQPPPGLSLMDSDESSSLRSSSTETTNVDERSSLTEYQQFTKQPTDPVILWKKPSRFEVVLAKSTATEESSTDPNLNEISSSIESRESKLTNFHLSLSEIGSEQGTLTKRIIALQENSDDFSFGLHSPDSFPNEIFAKKKEKIGMMSSDTDIIDLTILPPPLTPDEEKLALSSMPSAPTGLVETPPTPFADRLLEAELEQVRRAELSPSRASTLAALYQLSDIESFIAKVTVPPPPEDTKVLYDKEMGSQPHDLTEFIIPPPPPPRVSMASGTAKNTVSSHQKSIDSMSTISSVSNSRVTFTDREIQEINVAKETFFKEPREKISPRIASIQKMLANPGSVHDALKTDAVDLVEKVKKASPPPPPPRSSASKASIAKPIKDSSIQSSQIAMFDVQAAKMVMVDSEVPPLLPPRILGNVKQGLSLLNELESTTKPVLPTKSHRSLPKVPDPEPIQPDVKSEKPALPKKGVSSAVVEQNKELLRSKSELGVKKSFVDTGPLPHLKPTVSDLQLSPLKPRAVSGSPLRINQNSSREGTVQLVHSPRVKRAQHQSSSSQILNSPRQINGSKQLADVELESGVDSDTENVEFEKIGIGSESRHKLFEQAESVVVQVIASIDRAQHLCNTPQEREENPQTSALYQRAKEQLTNDSRQFVTASKLFVKSATENERQLLECLSHCVHLIDRIGTVSHDVASYTPTPAQTNGLLSKVRDVAETYLSTVRAAGQAAGKDLNDPSMDVLMKRATTLASVLTNLMRTLRVFV